jgi:ribose transport system ATP-binding protein
VLLDMRDVSTNGISGVNLQVKAGEVVGLAGLMGSGRTEVTRALFGIDRVTAGVISLRGRDYRPIGPKSAMNDGVALVPEDRRKQGLITSHSVQENLTINRLNENEVFGFLSNRKIETMAASLIRRFQIKVNRPKSAAARLSGGNQQKIVISKWLGREPDLLILDEPTAGVDIGTKNEVLREVSRYAEQGKGVLFISSEFQEMIAICDRYYIMKNGTVVGTVGSDDINDEADLMLAIAHTDPKRRAIDNQIEE